MKYITTAIREIGFVNEDCFEAFLIKNGVKYNKVEDVMVYNFGVYGGKEYSFYDYKKGNGQRVLACSTFISIVDEAMEEIELFHLDGNEEYTIDQVSELIREINKKKIEERE